MNWNDLLSLDKWQRLSALPYALTPIADLLFELDGQAFCLGTPYSDESLQVQDGGPFMGCLLWACDRSAALRAVERQIEKDQLIQNEPPKELIPFSSSRTYGAILNGLNGNHFPGIIESASYRVAVHGRKIALSNTAVISDIG